MTSSWQAVLVKCKYEPRIIPILLAIIRLSICWLPQTGYLHPDEFFQSPEIIAKDYFNINVQPVWEFATDQPIRCMLIPSLLNKLAFKFAEVIQTKPSAYLLLVAPRLAYTLLSFVIDICLYKICQFTSSRGLWYLPVSIIFQSSFTCLGCLNRSLSNTSETVILALLLVIVCHTIKPRFRILFVTPTRSTPVTQRVKGSTQIKSSILVGVLVTLGIFNRPTFPCFALVPCLYWFFESMKRNSYSFSLVVQRILVPLALSTATTAFLISAYDTAYYNGLETLKDLLGHLLNYRFEDFHSELTSRWVMTPYNFIVYNTDPNNLSKYGLHLPCTHMFVNIPLAFNLLGLMFYGKLFNLLVGSGVYRLLFSAHRFYAMMLLTIVTSTILLSFIPHQEFRFLLPIIVPLVYAFAFNIYTSNKLLSIWLLFNLTLVYFYTSVHQAGVMRASLDLDPILKAHAKENQDKRLVRVNVIALRCYLAPSYQWNIKEDDDRFNFDLQDTFDDFNSSLNLKLGRVLSLQKEYPLYNHLLYIMLPRLYETELGDHLDTQFFIDPSRVKVINHYSPHFSGEEFQKSISYIQEHGLIKGWRRAFGFTLLQLDLND